jgi:hypothetical protein
MTRAVCFACSMRAAGKTQNELAVLHDAATMNDEERRPGATCVVRIAATCVVRIAATCVVRIAATCVVRIAATCVVRIAATCVVKFAHAQMSFTNGLLHSTGNRPAAVFKPVECSSHTCANTIGIVRDRSYHAVRDRSYHAFRDRSDQDSDACLEFKASARGHQNWYSEGDLHRDRGPAVIGELCWCIRQNSIQDIIKPGVWWVGYYHGEPMAFVANREWEKPKHCSAVLAAHCGWNCEYLSIVARALFGVYDSDTKEYETVKWVTVCRTCTGKIIEYSRGMMHGSHHSYYKIKETGGHQLIRKLVPLGWGKR